MDKIHKFPPIIKQKFGLVFGGILIDKTFHTVLGINQERKKDVLGLYLSENEGANFWLSVLTDLQNRGVKDILIGLF